MSFILPRDSERLVILGQTGTGKSVAGIWHLSQRNFDRMPWILFDPKRESLLAKMKKEKMLEEIRIDKKPPRHPGLYIVHWEPTTDDDDYVELFLAKILNGSHTGLYVDEGFTIPQSLTGRKYTAFSRIQMQGRSKRIPTITLSQRPNFMSRFVWSEASYFQYFWLTDASDRDTLKRFSTIDANRKPDRYHSWWHDVSQDKTIALAPVPPPAMILETFRSRLGRSKTRFV
jgi:hypothetical protein